MTLSIEQYCTKHNYELIETYSTIGDERGSHLRAIVKHKETGKVYRLYYDRSYRKRTLAQQKRDYLEIQKGFPVDRSKYYRGWRNTTLDNQRKKQSGISCHDKNVSRQAL